MQRHTSSQRDPDPRAPVCDADDLKSDLAQGAYRGRVAAGDLCAGIAVPLPTTFGQDLLDEGVGVAHAPARLGRTPGKQGHGFRISPRCASESRWIFST